MDMENNSTSQHAVLVSAPGMGHLNSFLELANRLSSLHSFKTTVLFVSTSGGATQAPSKYSNVNLITIPAADISKKVDPEGHLVTKICVLMRETMPAIRAAISSQRPSMLIFDMFATDYLPIGRELGLPCYVYVGNAWLLALLAYCPVLEKEVEGEYIDQTQPLSIPGVKSVRPEDLLEAMHKRNEPQYDEFLRIGGEIHLFDGVLCSTWEDLERSTLSALRDGKNNLLSIPVYDIGPVVAQPYNNSSSSSESDALLMEWLDRQPAQSVLYISFGTGGTLSKAQMHEMASGLELSQQRFVWVVRPPKDGDASGTYLGGVQQGDNHDDAFFPNGFKNKTRRLGRLVPRWAPQSKVLAHPSVGGFLTHCGWNSVTESLTNGIPMIAWPMFAEQMLNATMLVEDLEVAVRTSHLPSKKVATRDEIAKLVLLLLRGEEGKLMKLKAQQLQTSAAQALAPNGSSYKRLSHLVQTLSPLIMPK